jgi:cytochrome b6-f complex iron-sulfur subunit
MLAAGTATARFMFPNVLFEPPSSFRAGRPQEFQTGVVDERFKVSNGVWLVRDQQGIYALSTICTHLGCTPNWLAAEQKFKCPCHGSGFYITGINFEGPAPRPLERFSIRQAEDGQIVVDKSQKFQEEKGQWENPSAKLIL